MSKVQVFFLNLFRNKIFLIIFLTIPILLPFFNSKFFYTQDYIFIARLNQMSTALSSGQFPVRWAPDLRYGEPLFNFYAPLPYYIGAAIHALGFNFIWVAKILFILGAFFSALAMFYLCREIFDENAAIFAAVLYTYAPYRALDTYIRGTLSETWAFVFFPLIFYAALLLSRRVNFVRIIFLALALAGLFLTHNVTTLMFLPFFALFIIYLIFSTNQSKFLFSSLVGSALALGIASFFLIPALLERQFIQTKYLIVGYFDFRVHFVAIYQFFSTFWGYGTSGYGLNDGLSFQVGLVHWSVIALSLILGIIFRKDKKVLGLLSFLGFSFLLSLFLQHNKSTFIWETIPTMAYIQFPWRFLAISIFIVSIMGAFVLHYLVKIKSLSLGNRPKVVYIILIGLTIIINFQYFNPKEFVDDSFFDKFLNVETMHKGIDLTKDYLPIWVETTDGERFDIPRSVNGNITVSNVQKTSTTYSAMINVTSGGLIEMPITYFPGWEVSANGRQMSLGSPSKMGLIRLDLPKGNFNIKSELKNTPVRMGSNIISVFSILVITLLFVFRKNNFNA